jgi:hypothetical protein
MKSTWLTGHQPNYLPYPGFFSKVLKADAFVVVDHVQIQKEQKRNLIAGPLRLSLHVLGSKRQRICDAQLNNPEVVLRKHWESIRLTYSKYPYYESLSPHFERLYSAGYRSFSDFTTSLILTVLKLLNYNKPVFKSSSVLSDLSPKNNDLIIAMCKQLGYQGYISGTGAKDYIKEEKFSQAGLLHQFNEYQPIQYGASTDNLCILDPLFSIGSLELIKILRVSE